MNVGGHTGILAITSKEFRHLIGLFIKGFFQFIAVDFQFAGFGIGGNTQVT
ncbi:hypothetical protein D3C72_2266040 [compost metagenome]